MLDWFVKYNCDITGQLFCRVPYGDDNGQMTNVCLKFGFYLLYLVLFDLFVFCYYYIKRSYAWLIVNYYIEIVDI